MTPTVQQRQALKEVGSHILAIQQYFTELSDSLRASLGDVLTAHENGITQSEYAELKTLFKDSRDTKQWSDLIDEAAKAVEQNDPDEAIKLVRSVLVQVAAMPSNHAFDMRPVTESLQRITDRLSHVETTVTAHEDRISALESQVKVYLEEQTTNPQLLQAITREVAQQNPTLNPQDSAFKAAVKNSFWSKMKGTSVKVGTGTRRYSHNWLKNAGYVKSADQEFVQPASNSEAPPTKEIPVGAPDKDAHTDRKVA